jgi:hypothetical protein
MKSFTREETQARKYSECYTRMAAGNSCGISTVAGEITNVAALEDKRHNKWCNRWYRMLLARSTGDIHFKDRVVVTSTTCYITTISVFCPRSLHVRFLVNVAYSPEQHKPFNDCNDD